MTEVTEKTEKSVIESFLTRINVSHRFVQHAAITSVKDALEKGIPEQLGIPLENVVKNLLLKDSRHNLYLLVTAGMTRVNLRTVAALLETTHLSMAHLDEAKGLFGIYKGTVSLFDLVGSDTDDNSNDVSVTLVLDGVLETIKGDIAFPTGSNEESVLIHASDLRGIVEEIGSWSSHIMNSTTLKSIS